MLNTDTPANDANMEEFLPEEYNIVTDGSHYVRIDWFSEDPTPEYPFFETSEFGPCPKCVALLGGVPCVRTDFSIISKS